MNAPPGALTPPPDTYGLPRREKEPVPDNRHLVWGDRFAVDDKVVGGVKTTDPRPLCNDLLGDGGRESQLPCDDLSRHVVDVNEPTVIVMPTKVGPADTQLRSQRRVAGEQRTCLLSTGKSLLCNQQRWVCR